MSRGDRLHPPGWPPSAPKTCHSTRRVSCAPSAVRFPTWHRVCGAFCPIEHVRLASDHYLTKPNPERHAQTTLRQRYRARRNQPWRALPRRDHGEVRCGVASGLLNGPPPSGGRVLPLRDAFPLDSAGGAGTSTRRLPWPTLHLASGTCPRLQSSIGSLPSASPPHPTAAQLGPGADQ